LLPADGHLVPYLHPFPRRRLRCDVRSIRPGPQTPNAFRPNPALVWGADDIPHVLIDELIEEHPAWTFEAVDGIGHLLPLEAPEKYVDIVGRWATSPPDLREAVPRLPGASPDRPGPGHRSPRIRLCRLRVGPHGSMDPLVKAAETYARGPLGVVRHQISLPDLSSDRASHFRPCIRIRHGHR
jgi:hypothetical protein